MYLVFVDWDGDVNYGIDSATYLLGIFEKEENAISVVSEWGVLDSENETIERDHQLNIPESKWSDLNDIYHDVGWGWNPSESGELSIRYTMFKPGMFTGGGWYLE